jgi:hypothetical protein
MDDDLWMMEGHPLNMDDDLGSIISGTVEYLKDVPPRKPMKTIMELA